jgi:hypothetical protein
MRASGTAVAAALAWRRWPLALGGVAERVQRLEADLGWRRKAVRSGRRQQAVGSDVGEGSS